jgi:pyruvate/2-oxoglutarate dehydrogenase complex dihydrolipoamide acyltransferase (E2) component
MTDDQLAGFAAGSWLPPRAVQVIAREEAHERAEARRAEIERADQADQRHESAVAEYRRQAELRGEQLSAVALATGEGLGRSVGDVLEEAAAEADRADARERAREGRNAEWLGAGEPVIRSRGDGWPESSWEVDRIVRQAQDGRTWMAGYLMRAASRRGQAAAHIEAQRAEANRRDGADLRRSRPASHLTSQSAPAGYLSRVTPNAITDIW